MFGVKDRGLPVSFCSPSGPSLSLLLQHRTRGIKGEAGRTLVSLDGPKYASVN